MPEIDATLQTKAKPDPKALTPEYHKAHKQAMMWAAILLVWELVGVDLEKAKEAGGNAGAIIRSIKSPQAIPWVLLALVAYFLFKVTVEWYQSNRLRRATRMARADLLSAWILSILAGALYIEQTLSRAQLADRLQNSAMFRTAMIVVLAIFFVAHTLWTALMIRRTAKSRWSWIGLWGVAALSGTLGVLGVLIIMLKWSPPGAFITAAFCYGASLIVMKIIPHTHSIVLPPENEPPVGG